jgi:hypothetical protein
MLSMLEQSRSSSISSSSTFSANFSGNFLALAPNLVFGDSVLAFVGGTSCSLSSFLSYTADLKVFKRWWLFLAMGVVISFQVAEAIKATLEEEEV